MRDENPWALAKNLAQEPWGIPFFKTCINRTKNHGHYEDYGRAVGRISVGREKPQVYDFGTFRDHSWDIRRWAAIDHLLILLIDLERPLVLDGLRWEVECWTFLRDTLYLPNNAPKYLPLVIRT